MATEYVVLRQAQRDSGGANPLSAWTEVGRASADNDTQAIKAVAGEGEAGTFVAVPVRSFRPRTRTIETKTVDRWS